MTGSLILLNNLRALISHDRAAFSAPHINPNAFGLEISPDAGTGSPLKTALLVSAVLIVFCASAFAQSRPEEGATDLQVWTSGGHSVAGGRGDTGIWNIGVRYGWVLTDAHLPGLLRGRFEYAIDAVPAYLIIQPERTVYGIGANPLNLKWNFATRGRIAPYMELSGGLLFSEHDVPAATSKVNFTPSAAFGTHFLGDKCAWSLEARYLHISNAGLSRLNPGLNTFEIRLGLGRFKK